MRMYNLEFSIAHLPLPLSTIFLRQGLIEQGLRMSVLQHHAFLPEPSVTIPGIAMPGFFSGNGIVNGGLPVYPASTLLT